MPSAISRKRFSFALSHTIRTVTPHIPSSPLPPRSNHLLKYFLERPGPPSDHSGLLYVVFSVRISKSNFAVNVNGITVRRVAFGHKDNHERKRKAEGQVSASRVGRSRTDPYQAPYFFPSPMSPGVSDYVQLAQHNRKPVLSDHAHTPMSTEGQQNVCSSLQSRGRLRSVWPPLHRRSSSHS